PIQIEHDESEERSGDEGDESGGAGSAFPKNAEEKDGGDGRSDVRDEFVDALEDGGVMAEQGRSDDGNNRAHDSGDFADANELLVIKVGPVACEQIVGDQGGGGVERGGAGLHGSGQHGGGDETFESRRQQMG